LEKKFLSAEMDRGEERTPGVVWLTVIMGGMLLMGNVAELGGVPLAAKEWTAWLLAGIVLVHGVSMSWRWGQESDTLRLPRWPLLALALVGGLAYAWWQDDSAPWLSRQTFVLGMEAWLLCWVVAASPGTRSLSWAWLMVLVAGAVLALTTAIACQATVDGLWLPVGRRLPVEWLGRWSGTLPLPGAFGALMLLAGPPLLVLACARRMPTVWRILCGSGGFAMLLGALLSFSPGAWLGVALALALLPLVVTEHKVIRWVIWVAGVVFMAWWIRFIYDIKLPREPWFAPLTAGEPTLSATWIVVAKAWQSDPWLGGHGASYTEMARMAGVVGPVGGWGYGFSDWSELAAKWGFFGLGLAVAVLVALLMPAWKAWARLPRAVSTEVSPEGSQPYMPETKVLLGAGAAGLTAFTVALTATRTLNVPAVVFGLAILAGVLSRNVPQRGGSFRIEPGMRRALSLGLAGFVAVVLVWKVALLASVQQKLTEAQVLLELADRRPDAELLVRARADLREVFEADPRSVPVYCNFAWLELAQARLNPEDAKIHANQAEYYALRASSLAPQAPEPWVVHALACWLVNRPHDAEDYLSRALELAPNDPAVRYYATALLTSDVVPVTLADGLRVLPVRYQAAAPWPPLAGRPAQPGNFAERP
jgi:hypothetical protein